MVDLQSQCGVRVGVCGVVETAQQHLPSIGLGTTHRGGFVFKTIASAQRGVNGRDLGARIATHIKEFALCGQGLDLQTGVQCEQCLSVAAFGHQVLSQECCVELDAKLIQGGEALLVVLQHELQLKARNSCGAAECGWRLVDQLAQIKVVERQDAHFAQDLVVVLGEPCDVACALTQTIGSGLRLEQPDLHEIVFWVRQRKARPTVGIGATTALQELPHRENLLRRHGQVDGLQVTAQGHRRRQVDGVGIDGECQRQAIQGLASAVQQGQSITALLLNAQGVGAVAQEAAQQGAISTVVEFGQQGKGIDVQLQGRTSATGAGNEVIAVKVKWQVRTEGAGADLHTCALRRNTGSRCTDDPLVAHVEHVHIQEHTHLTLIDGLDAV